MLRTTIAAAVLVLAATAAHAQNRDRSPFDLTNDQWCTQAQRGWNDDAFCEVRDVSLGTVRALDADTGGNGGIIVRGTTGSSIRVRARVITRARRDDDAKALAGDVHISTLGGRIRVDGPADRRARGWSVDLAIEVPRDMPLTLATRNGGISIRDYTGRADFSTVNGGLALSGVAGDLHGETTNGGITVALDGRSWSGAGLDLRTVNGGVSLRVPDSYSADLEVDTVHGGISTDIPITLQGRLFGPNGHLSTRLGSGGPPIRVRTTNGGIVLRRD
jgi:hypothetical protein